MKFVPLQEKDLEDIRRIYNYYVVNETATFHTQEISMKEFRLTIPFGDSLYRSYVLIEEEKVVGYCYFGRYKNRKAYDRTAEVTVYLDPDCRSKGYGSASLQKLEHEAGAAGISVLIGIICAENKGSIRLFEKQGYEKCAHFKQVGEKFGRILDVVAYQKIIRM